MPQKLTTRRLVTWSGTCFLLLFVALTLVAGQSWLQAGKHHDCDCCPECGAKACCPVPETTKEKKHTWCVECKEICIPGISGPFWPCCSAPPCGKVKTVNVLKKVEYECEKCGYKWEATCVQKSACGCR